MVRGPSVYGHDRFTSVLGIREKIFEISHQVMVSHFAAVRYHEIADRLQTQLVRHSHSEKQQTLIKNTTIGRETNTNVEKRQQNTT